MAVARGDLNSLLAQLGQTREAVASAPAAPAAAAGVPPALAQAFGRGGFERGLGVQEQEAQVGCRAC